MILGERLELQEEMKSNKKCIYVVKTKWLLTVKINYVFGLKYL